MWSVIAAFPGHFHLRFTLIRQAISNWRQVADKGNFADK